MRISNPRRFNGDILASRKELLQWLGLNFATPSAQLGVSGKLSASIIPDLSGLIYGSDQTLSDKFTAIEQNIADTIQPSLDTISGAVTGLVNDVAAEAAARIAGDTFISGTLLSGFSAEKTVSGEFDAVRKLIGDVQGEAAKISAGDAIEFAGLSGGFTEINVKVAASDKVLTADETGLFADITLSGVTPVSGIYASAYQLVGKNGEVLGETINIPKDQFLKNVEYVPSETALDFTFYLADGTEKLTRVNVSGLVDTYTAGAGIKLANNEFSLGKDGNTDSKFLQIGNDTIGLSGITDAITAAVKTETDGRVEAVNAISGLLSGAQGTADTLVLAGGEGKFVDSEYVISNDETVVGETTLWTSEATTDYVSGQISATLQVVDDLTKSITKFYVDPVTLPSGEALVHSTTDNSTTLYVGGQEYVISTPLATDFADVLEGTEESETAATVLAVKEYVSGQIADKPDTAVEGADGLVTKLTYTTDADYDLTVFRGAELSGAADTDVLTAGAVKTAVTTINSDIEAIKTTVSKAVELVEQTVTLTKGTDAYSATVTGRVLNIFDETENEVFINKVYDKDTGITTLSVGSDEVEAEGDITLTVIVAKTLAVREIIRLILQIQELTVI